MLRDILIQKGLSNRESEVAELVTKGLSNKEVANQLFVTEKTVKFHLTNIYKKMNVKSRAQLIVWCLPHMQFVEKEQGDAGVVNQAPAANSIPAGNATVSQPESVATIPTITPGNGNNFGSGHNTGSFGI